MPSALRACVRGSLRPQASAFVAFLAPNSSAYLCYSLAVMVCGGVSVHLNWRMPTATTAHLLLSLQPTLLLTAAPLHLDAATATAGRDELRVARLDEPLMSGRAPSSSDVVATLCASSASRLDPHATAVVFFTGGTTGTPKAVPHTHAGLLWFAAHCAEALPAPGEGTVCFTPYFHVMGFVANFVFNLYLPSPQITQCRCARCLQCPVPPDRLALCASPRYLGCRACVLAEDAHASLSPQILLDACRVLRPSALNTVPWILEDVVVRLGGADGAEVAAALQPLELVTYGGAALAPHCAEVLKAHAFRIAGTYGQTELAGPVLFGALGGDPNALRPMRGVQHMLVRRPASADASADDADVDADVGELVLLGNMSATSGYLTLEPGRAHRSLTGDGTTGRTPQEHYRTNDLFRYVAIDGDQWLVYMCRRDDVLVHTSGEMTNPLPWELRDHTAPLLCPLPPVPSAH